MGIEKVPAKIDMLHGSLWDKLPRFALPVAATAILEQLFNASDIAIVGNFSSGDKTVAVAAVGANSPLIGLILNLFIGIALGCQRRNCQCYRQKGHAVRQESRTYRLNRSGAQRHSGNSYRGTGSRKSHGTASRAGRCFSGGIAVSADLSVGRCRSFFSTILKRQCSGASAIRRFHCRLY